MMVALLLALTGCIPSEIPRQDAPIDASTLPDLISAASPDYPVLFYTTVYQLSLEGYRDCPRVDATSSGISILADNCTDGAGFTWNGVASVSFTSAGTQLAFQKFRVERPDLEDGWQADGWINAEAAGSEIRMTSKLKVTSFSMPERVMWIDTSGGFVSGGGPAYVEQYTGRVGFQDLGLVDIQGDRIALGQINGCSYADHFSGRLSLTGQEQADVYFAFQFPDLDGGDTGDGTDTDTGGTDTGDTGGADTGDTAPADTGPVDTGDTADTGARMLRLPTADADTGGLRDTADTGAGGDDGGDDGGFDFVPEGEGGVCGTCADVYVRDQILLQCHTAKRTLALPFEPPF